MSDAELKKLQEKRVKTEEERYQQRKGELSRRYEVDVTPELVEKDDDGWYPQLRLHYYLSVGRQFLTSRDSKRAKAQAEAGENAIWKPDFNKGQMLSSVLLLSELNLLQLLTPGEQLRGSDKRMQEFKAAALQHRYLIKNYLNVTISEKLTPVAIAQKLLDKIDLRLTYVGRLGPRGKRECVYKFVGTDDGRSGIFKQWLNRELVSVTSNIELQKQVADTTPLPSNQDMGGQENSTDSWWRQVKSYAAGLRERVESGVEAVKEFLSTLTSDERWGVMMAFEEAQPQLFGHLVAAAPDWLEWMA